MTSCEDTLARRYLPDVQGWARAYAARYPHLADECESAAVYGLLQALRKRPNPDAGFRTYLYTVVLGQMKNAVLAATVPLGYRKPNHRRHWHQVIHSLDATGESSHRVLLPFCKGDCHDSMQTIESALKLAFRASPNRARNTRIVWSLYAHALGMGPRYSHKEIAAAEGVSERMIVKYNERFRRELRALTQES